MFEPKRVTIYMPAGIWEEIQDFVRRESVRLSKTISPSGYLVRLHQENILKRPVDFPECYYCGKVHDPEIFCSERRAIEEEAVSYVNHSIPDDVQGVIENEGKGAVDAITGKPVMSYSKEQQVGKKPKKDK